MRFAVAFQTASRRAETAMRDFEASYLPSPLEVFRGMRVEFKAHCVEARAAQEDFQEFLNDLGISRIERHANARETLELYQASRPGRYTPR